VNECHRFRSTSEDSEWYPLLVLACRNLTRLLPSNCLARGESDFAFYLKFLSHSSAEPCGAC
jgi:hypothetical protein